MNTLRVATFNLLYQHASAPRDTWDERRRLARRAVERARPDAIGFQEVFPSMLPELQDIAGELAIVPGPTTGGTKWFDLSVPIGMALESLRTGRLPERMAVRALDSERMRTGEHLPIAYRADRLRPIEDGAFWISPTPGVSGAVSVWSSGRLSSPRTSPSSRKTAVAALPSARGGRRMSAELIPSR